jgi:hypothetical protein
MQNQSKDSSRSPRVPSPPSSRSTSRRPASAFSEAFLASLRLLSRAVDEAPPRAGLGSSGEGEALLAGPFSVEAMERPDGARFAVVRPDEPLAAGGKACAVYRERDEALRLAAVLPAIAAPRLYHLGSRPKAHGCYALHRSRRFVGHLARGVERLSPERRRTLMTHLDLARYLACHPRALALILESVGPEALPVLGRALARRIEAALPE